jgi:hypothetical protein
VCELYGAGSGGGEGDVEGARRPSLNRDSGIELPSVYDLILN